MVPAGTTSGRRRSRARRGEGEALRDEILQAAIDLLAETGDESAVSIRAVADRVGKTPPSIYLHFADKDELMTAACEQQYLALAELSNAAQEGIDDPVERIRACGQAYVQFAIDHPAEYRVLFLDQREFPEKDIDDLKNHVAFRSLYDNVVAGFEAGRFRGPGPDLVSLVLWATVHGIASLLVAHPSAGWPPAAFLVDLAVDQQFNGLLEE